VKGRFAKYADIELKDLGHRNVELHCTVAPDVEQTWRIDTAHGDVVTYSQLDVFERAKDLWHEAIEKTEVAWEERNGVWVPTALLVERNFNGVETYEIELDWESVNKELSDDEFEPEALHVETGSLLVDTRLGDRPIVVGEIERDEEPSAASVPEPGTLRGSWILAIALLLILAAFAAWIWRRRTLRTN
jgi:hypothetical protein